jgi:hypothetical protein
MTIALEAAIGKIEALGGLTPRGIRTHLGLNKPIYRKTPPTAISAARRTGIISRGSAPI